MGGRIRGGKSYRPRAFISDGLKIPDDVKHCWVSKSFGLVESHVTLQSKDDNSTADSQQNETAGPECPLHASLKEFNETVFKSMKELPNNFTDIFKEVSVPKDGTPYNRL